MHCYIKLAKKQSLEYRVLDVLLLETMLVTTKNPDPLPLRPQIWQIRAKSGITTPGLCPVAQNQPCVAIISRKLGESVATPTYFTTVRPVFSSLIRSLHSHNSQFFLPSWFHKSASVVHLLVPSSLAVHVTAILSTVAVLYFVYIFDF